MTASVFFTATGVLAIGSAWYFFRPLWARSQDDVSPTSKWQEQSERIAQTPTNIPTHRAVSVCPGVVSCHAVRQHGETRFLSGDAPLLPLRECDQAKCECIYEHYDDRRVDGDRRNTYAAYSGFDPMQGKEERRDRNERRKR